MKNPTEFVIEMIPFEQGGKRKLLNTEKLMFRTTNDQKLVFDKNSLDLNSPILLKITAIYAGNSYKEGMDDKLVPFNLVINRNLFPGVPFFIWKLVLVFLVGVILLLYNLNRIHRYFLSLVENFQPSQKQKK